MKFELDKEKRFDKNETHQVEDFKQEIGGSWDLIGNLGFEFIKDKLDPSDSMIDIACGSLRIGRFIIDYLEPGNYMGIEMQEELLNSAIYDVIGLKKYKEKRPKLLVDGDFNFKDFKQHWPYFKKPKIGLAQSLFTHLNFEDIKICLNKLKEIVDKDFILYATFHSAQGGWHTHKFSENYVYGKTEIHLLDSSRNVGGNPFVSDSGSHVDFWYSSRDLEEISNQTGWVVKEIFDWNHPRYQLMTTWTLKKEKADE